MRYERIYLNRDGYSSDGRYFGVGAPLYLDTLTGRYFRSSGRPLRSHD